jgi:hypothetical protein
MVMQPPRIMSVPAFASSSGPEALELAASAGLVLDEWQQLVLSRGLGETEEGTFAALEVALVVPRQNGKSEILLARELAGLFLLGERLLIHSAHTFSTSLEAFLRLQQLIEANEDLSRRVKRVTRAHGEEGIELIGGQRIRFRTRTSGGGRGFAADLVVFDESMFLAETAHAALLPTLSARPNPQVWYAGSAVDQLVHEHGLVLARTRGRGITGEDPSLAYFEWSLEEPAGGPDHVPDEVAGSEEAWRAANPALGIRIAAEHIANERRSMSPRNFAVERLGIGDWPALDVVASVIPIDAWLELRDDRSKPVDPVVFCFDVSPNRSTATIAAAGFRPDGLAHVEVVDHRRGTGWVPARVVELAAHRPIAILFDGASPAASLAAELEAAGVEVRPTTAGEHAQAAGLLFDMVEQRRLRHLATSELSVALRGAAKRPLGDAWAWSRKSSTVDITPLVAVTLALWGATTLKPPPSLEPAFAWA